MAASAAAAAAAATKNNDNNKATTNKPSLLSLSLNQDHSCIACGTSSGFRILNSDPLREVFRREFDAGPRPSSSSLEGPGASRLSDLRRYTAPPSTLAQGLQELTQSPLPHANPASAASRGDPFSCRSSTATQSGLASAARSGLPREQHPGSTPGPDIRSSDRSQSCPPLPLSSPSPLPATAWDPGSPASDGFTIVEMLFRSNIIALVSPRYSLNKVLVWDDHLSACIGELLFRTRVRALRLCHDRLAVVLEHKIFTYSLADLRLIHQVETLANWRGLCALVSAAGYCIMACPGVKCGEVRVEHYSSKKTLFIQAHTSAIACISLCRYGMLLATASTKGTLVRIFNASDGTKLQEFRRGADRADIHSLAFSPNNTWLVVSSDKGTIHVFCIKESSSGDGRHADGHRITASSGYVNLPSSLSASITNGIQLARSSFLSLARPNTGSSLAFMKGVLPRYFSSEWSFAQFRLPEDSHTMVAFGSERNSIIVLCSNGSYYKCSFDVNRGGEMVLEENINILNAPFVS